MTPKQHHKPRTSLAARVSLGRVGRARLGILLILADIGLVFLDAINHEKVTTPDVALHLGLLAGGLSLIDPKIKVTELLWNR